MPDFRSERALYLDQKKPYFAKNCMIQKTREKVLLQIFWWIEIVSMDPKSNVILSGDIFEYSYNLIK